MKEAGYPCHKSLFHIDTVNTLPLIEELEEHQQVGAVIKPFGEIVKVPFDVLHTAKELKELANFTHSLEGECRVVMEHTNIPIQL